MDKKLYEVWTGIYNNVKSKEVNSEDCVFETLSKDEAIRKVQYFSSHQSDFCFTEIRVYEENGFDYDVVKF